MKHHDGEKRINKVDGGKGRARKQYHKALRQTGKRQAKQLHCRSCNAPVPPDHIEALRIVMDIWRDKMKKQERQIERLKEKNLHLRWTIGERK
jgi:hypothetical protein